MLAAYVAILERVVYVKKRVSVCPIRFQKSRFIDEGGAFKSI